MMHLSVVLGASRLNRTKHVVQNMRMWYLSVPTNSEAHILVECVDLNDVHNKHFIASSVKDKFSYPVRRIDLEWH